MLLNHVYSIHVIGPSYAFSAIIKGLTKRRGGGNLHSSLWGMDAPEFGSKLWGRQNGHFF